MKLVMEQLLALQALQFGVRARTPELESEMNRIRDRLPAPIVTRYERLALRGKKAVALVRNGVCLECHLRLPTGTLAGLSDANVTHVCDACGRFLYLAEDNPAGPGVPKPSAPAPAKRRRQEVARHGD